MLREAVNGFCMALADSVPGVSGGTIAFIMGFYDQFIGSIHDLAFGGWEKKKQAAIYLAKLGVGWLIGMMMAVLVLSALFESHIYTVSSLFIGFIAGSIPLIAREEADSVKQVGKGILFFVLGAVLVAGITYMNSGLESAAMNLQQFSVGQAIRLFLIGMVAISAMFLPGISGSTLLLIFGAYIPVISAIKGVLSFELSYIPSLAFFGCGIAAGALSVVKLIQVCLEKFRPQMVYAILGMLVGSFYAIAMGPTTLEVPQAALNPGSFQILAALAGAALVLGLQLMKSKMDGSQKA